MEKQIGKELQTIMECETILRVLTFRSGAIGDTLLAFPIIQVLREKYRGSHFTFVGHPAVLPLAQAWGLADEVYDMSQCPWVELYQDEGIISPNWRNLLQKTDLAISLMRNGSEPLKRNLLEAGAREAIVAHEDQDPRPLKHVAECLAHSIGLQDFSAHHIPPITSSDKVFRLFNPPVVIHPGSSEKLRCWPTESFAAVINHLLAIRQPVLLLAGPLDDEQLRDVRRHVIPSPQPGLFTILRNAPILEVAQKIQQCKCYLGNDTGMTHLAALLGVPTIVMTHSSALVYIHPLGSAVEIIAVERLERLPVKKVFEAVHKYV